MPNSKLLSWQDSIYYLNKKLLTNNDTINLKSYYYTGVFNITSESIEPMITIPSFDSGIVFIYMSTESNSSFNYGFNTQYSEYNITEPQDYLAHIEYNGGSVLCYYNNMWYGVSSYLTNNHEATFTSCTNQSNFVLYIGGNSGDGITYYIKVYVA